MCHLTPKLGSCLCALLRSGSVYLCGEDRDQEVVSVQVACGLSGCG